MIMATALERHRYNHYCVERKHNLAWQMLFIDDDLVTTDVGTPQMCSIVHSIVACFH